MILRINRYSHLPASIRFEESGLPDNELSFYLQGRFMEWREYVMRPILFYVLHRDTGSTCQPHILALAQKHVDLCADIISHSTYHHHHGGTWFVARHSFSCAVLILAVVQSPADLCPPRNWMDIVRYVIKYLATMGTMALNVAEMGVILQRLFVDICQRGGYTTPERR